MKVDCPSKDKKCDICGAYGHLAKKCDLAKGGKGKKGQGKGKESPVCWEFQKTGTCPRGDTCKWSHGPGSPGATTGASGGVRHEDDPACKVYVGNLSYKTMWAGLKDFFSSAGTVKYVKVLEDKGKGKGNNACN